MSRTRVKLCGMREPDQVAQAVSLGVDAVGMIFYGDSPRYVDEQAAVRIRAVIPAFVQLVGVFVNERVEVVNRLAKDIGLDLVQLHGEEGADYVRQLKVPYLKAVRVKDAEYVSQQLAIHTGARGLLLDTYSSQLQGGTGKQFDVGLLPKDLPCRVIVAGGIDNENVVPILEQLNPYAIDVNSGLEHSPANKNMDALALLLEKVRAYDIGTTS